MKNVPLSHQAQETAALINAVHIQSPIETNTIPPCYIYSLFILLGCDVSNTTAYLTFPGNTAEQLAVDFG